MKDDFAATEKRTKVYWNSRWTSKSGGDVLVDKEKSRQVEKGGRGSWRFRPLAPTSRVGGGRK